jgi:GR25 family glycosyltransferase involved in LPS biosynthesis
MLETTCPAVVCPWDQDGGTFCRQCGAAVAQEVADALTVRVINLDRSADRLAEFCRVNAHLGTAERVQAVDGTKLDQAALVASGMITPDLVRPDFYSIGGLGCAMSHLQMIDRAINQNTTITVAEDDAIFNVHFLRKAGGILTSLPSDWDFILWGFNWDLFAAFELIPRVSLCLAQLQHERLQAQADEFQKARLTPQSFALKWAFGIPCYSISPKGARIFKSRLVPLRPKVLPFPEGGRTYPNSSYFRTVGIDNHFNELYGQTKSFVCFPPLVATKIHGFPSTVQVQ